MRFTIRPLTPEDRPWVVRILEEHWSGTRIVTRGRIHRADELPGFMALVDEEPSGMITYNLEGEACEIVSLDSSREGMGIGTALIEAVKEKARTLGCFKLWLITTNDNLKAVGFYQKRGFRLATVHPGAVEASRKLKPKIPEIGIDGIPIRDEVELDMTIPSPPRAP